MNNTFRGISSFEDTYRNDAIGTVAARVIDEFTPDVAHVHHLTGLSTTIVRLLAERNTVFLHAARLLAPLPSRPTARRRLSRLRRPRG